MAMSNVDRNGGVDFLIVRFLTIFPARSYAFTIAY